MSIVKTRLVNADAEGRCFTLGERDPIKLSVVKGARRAQLVQVLADGRDRIVKQGANPIF
jgi:hypothetical protein